jgi:hypothetical protein
LKKNAVYKIQIVFKKAVNMEGGCHTRTTQESETGLRCSIYIRAFTLSLPSLTTELVRARNAKSAQKSFPHFPRMIFKQKQYLMRKANRSSKHLYAKLDALHG